MKYVLPNYNRCITNLTGSILKYFGLDYKNKTLKEIDDVINQDNPQNVVVLLIDGMGYNLLMNKLDIDSFLNKNLVSKISSVAPSATTSATTSVLSGLNPSEHGWIGWDVYIKPIDKIVGLFLNTEKDSDVKVADYNVADKYFGYQSIIDKINARGICYAKKFFPFGENAYQNFDDMNHNIICECQKVGKKFIYAYYDALDNVMHEYGTDSLETMNKFKMINDKIEYLCSQLEDTLIIVTADHGHLNCDGILLADYPDFYDTLDGDTWLEGRLCAFKVKDNRFEEFETLFKKYFENDFILKTKEEVIEEKLFGYGNEHSLFRSSLGDYLALGISNKYFRYSEKSLNWKSVHSGFTEDEMYVPLIMIVK